MTVHGVGSELLAGDPLGDVVELFLRREDAEGFLAECLNDELEWAGVLSRRR